jgi:tetratricopeptide (TPR) repeat protein
MIFLIRTVDSCSLPGKAILNCEGVTMIKRKIFFICIMILAFGCDKSDNLPADQLITKGRQLYQEGNVDDAFKLFKKAIKLKPDNAALHFELGCSYFNASQKSYDEALRRSLSDFSGEKHDPDNDKEMMRYGYRMDFYTSALSEFNETLKYDPSNWKARYYIASDFFNHKKYNEAIVESKKIIQLAPDYTNGFSLLGEAYSRTGQDQLAIEMLKRAVKLKPDGWNYYQLGMAYKRNHNWEKVAEISHKLKNMDEMRYKALTDPSNYNW